MKKLLSIISIVFLITYLPSIAYAGQNVLDTDTFNGTAGTGLHTYNANWVNAAVSASCGDPVISTPNGAAKSAGGDSCDRRDGQTWTNDQYVQVTFKVLATSLSAMACVRFNGSASSISSGYCIGTDIGNGGTQKLALFKATTPNTELKLSATTVAANDVINLQIVGTTITVTKNGATVSDLTTTDASFASGNPGIFIRDTTGQLSAWTAGSVTGSTVAKASAISTSGNIILTKGNLVMP